MTSEITEVTEITENNISKISLNAKTYKPSV